MGVCLFSGCNSDSRKHKYITFHRIPSNKLLLYFEMAQRTDIVKEHFMKGGKGGFSSYHICSRHFKPEDFLYSSKGIRTLKETAVPNYDPISHTEEEVRRKESPLPSPSPPQPPKKRRVDKTGTAESPGFGAEIPPIGAMVDITWQGATICGEPTSVVQPLETTSASDQQEPAANLGDTCSSSGSSLRSLLQIPVCYSVTVDHGYASSVPTNVTTSILTSSNTQSTTFTTSTTSATSATSASLPLMTSMQTTSSIKVDPKLQKIHDVTMVDDLTTVDPGLQDYDYEFDVRGDLSAELEDLDPEDLNFSQHVTSIADGSIWEENEEDCSEVKVDESRIHFIYQSCIMNLFEQVRCYCGGRLKDPELSESKGSLLLIKAICSTCDEPFEWRSQPKLGRKSHGNVKLAASLYLTGQSFSAVAKWLKLANVQFISDTTFYVYQHDYILPAIGEAYDLSVQRARVEVNERKEPVRLAGDGRYDSPGHSARYCTYTLIDTFSGKVTHNLTLETANCSSATMAEKDGFVICLNSAVDHFSTDSPLETVTTDGNLSIRAYMEHNGEELGVVHGLDLWHLQKNLASNLAKKCKRKAERELIPWISHITNHVWWAAASCGRDEELLKEMVWSMKYHLVGNHTDFYGHHLFKQCAHLPITREEHEQLAYITPGSPAHDVLVGHLHDRHFVKQLGLTSHGQHTGKLESLHSMMLAYVTKRIDYDPPSYNGRVQLSVLDYNENIGRPVKTNADGTEVLRQVWSKAVKDYRLKREYVPKTYAFRETLLVSILQSATSTATPTPHYTGRNIATKEKPDLEEAISQHYKHRRF